MTTGSDTRRIAGNELHEFVVAVLREVDLSKTHATIVADSLVDANLRGIDTHGVLRLPAYVDRLEANGMNPRPEIEVETDGATGIVDGDDGPGQVVTVHAMDAACELASTFGSGFVGARRSNHFGTASYFTERAARSGFIGISMTNAAPNMVPFGGTEPYFGTNPLSVSIPAPGDPVTLDMATTVTTHGRLELARKEGESVPSEWAVDEKGSPTTDPEAYHALRPIAGPKGYGLAFVIDVLCGPLLRAHFGRSVRSLYGDASKAMELAHLVAAIDVESFVPRNRFVEDVGSMVDALHSMEAAEGFEEVMVPGEPERRTAAERREDGIPIGAGVWDSLEQLAKRYEVELSQDAADR